MNAPSRDIFMQARAWPVEEARRLLERLGGKVPAKGYVLFETGYGPSGLPHLGTFGEVARTIMVQYAFQQLSDIPTRLIAFSDDMDGLRKVPDNIPNPTMLAQHIGKPLTAIPDPFEQHETYGAYMNAKLREFLDRFGFAYEFKSATECYKSGLFDTALLKVLEHFDAIMATVLPILGEERQETYSPILPICPDTGVVLQVAITARDVKAGTISYQDAQGKTVTVPVTGGHCKLQWRADWAMRWAALEVDYEMFGKDLIPSATIASTIAETIGGRAPLLFQYEHFLDEEGAKISKSKGNGLGLEEWINYAPIESLTYFLFQSPRKAKRLYFDVIPRYVDDYLTWLAKFPLQTEAEKVENPVLYVHQGKPLAPTASLLNYSMLLNLATVCNPDSSAMLWKYISNYDPGITAESDWMLGQLVDHAVKYYNDFVKPTKQYKEPTREDIATLVGLRDTLKTLPNSASVAQIQNIFYDYAQIHGVTDMRGFFKLLYQLLLGQEDGPRLGSFIAIYGIENMIDRMTNVIEGTNLGKDKR